MLTKTSNSKLLYYILFLTLYLFANVYFINTLNPDSVSEITNTILKTFLYLCFFSVLIRSFYIAFFYAATPDMIMDLSLNNFLSSTLNYLIKGCVFCFVYILIYEFNDLFLSLFKVEGESVDYYFLSTFSLAILFICFYNKLKHFFLPRNNNAYLHSGSSLGTAMLSRQSKLLSEKDIESVIVHEVGHAMSLAFSLNRICKIELFINKKSTGTEPYGRVRYEYIETNETKETETYYYEMLCAISGNVTEKYILNTSILGSISDNTRWFEKAETYLSQVNDGNDVFYPKPKNKIQLEHNNSIVEKLRAEQREKIRNLLSIPENMLVFNEIRDLIYSKLEDNSRIKINSEDIMPLLSKIQV